MTTAEFAAPAASARAPERPDGAFLAGRRTHEWRRRYVQGILISDAVAGLGAAALARSPVTGGISDTLLMADGTFWRRSFDGATIGLPEPLTPHSDPYWDGVPIGSGNSTYDGLPTVGFATAMADMRSMYFTEGRIFYIRAGSNALYWRWFNPENGLAGSREFSLPGGGGQHQLSNTSGVLFLADGYVYWSRAADGQLVRRPIVDHGPGTEQVTTAANATRGLGWGGDAEVVSGPDLDGVDWRTPGAFLRAD